MKTADLVEMLSGIQTIASIKKILNINNQKAIYFIHRLRKKGYVKTKYSSDKQRVYYISSSNALGGTSYVDIINKESPIKLSTSEVYRIYGKNISIEETIVYAVKTRKIRYILASLWLIKKITNWSEIYRLAKENNLRREIGALYDLASQSIPKIRKMNLRYKQSALPKKTDKYKFLIEGMKSRDFKSIEKTWKVYLPFNKSDLESVKNDIS